MNRFSMLLVAGLALPSALPAAEGPAAPNQLTEAEKAAGWRLLFDGRSLAGWRSFKRPTITTTNGWVVEDGWLKKVARKRGGDIISVDQFTDFELQWEWRIPPKANNGLKYFITEERGGAVGHEYQMIDDALVKNPKGQTASFYDVLPPRAHRPLKFAPESNHSRILVRGNHVEHWLNGEQVLTYELGSPEVLAAVAKSKFKTVPGFGARIKGHILLTDHGDEASFRNLKIRELPAN
jgi:hypothetical protein